MSTVYSDALKQIRAHIEKELREVFKEERRLSGIGSDPDKADRSARWAREYQELAGSIDDSWDSTVVTAMSARAVALNLLLQPKVGTEGRPEWSPEIAFFQAQIDLDEIYQRVRNEVLDEEEE